MPLHFLESLDTARLPWAAPDSLGAEEERHREHHELQVFTEVLATLALGRELVVPQSYAFDSLGFLRVASVVLEARDRVSSREHPFRPHLHGADSFEDAVSAILGRARAVENPFSSSLLPELNAAGRYGLDQDEVWRQARDFDHLLSSDWIGDERAQALHRVRTEFHGLPRAQARPPAVPTSLNRLLVAAVDDSSAMSRAAARFPEPVRETHDTLVRALRRLDPGGSGGFSGRSQLRLPHPWPGDAAGRTPVEIVGDARTLALVVEFVDTLYHTVVVDSIGTAQATFSTDVAAEEQGLGARAVAQELALAHYRLRAERPDWLPRPAREPGLQEEQPVFEIGMDTGTALAEPGTETALTALRAAAPEAFALLLAARAQGPGRTAKLAPFWAGVESLRAATTRAQAERALEKHLAYVAGVLAGQGSAGLAGKGLVEIGLTAAGAVGPAVASALWSLPGLLEYPATALGAVAPHLVRRGSQLAHRRHGTRRTARALGRVVDVRG